MSPGFSIDPSSEEYAVYEALEKILLNPSSNRKQFTSISDVIQSDSVPKLNEFELQAKLIAVNEWQVYIDFGQGKAPLLRLRTAVGSTSGTWSGTPNLADTLNMEKMAVKSASRRLPVGESSAGQQFETTSSEVSFRTADRTRSGNKIPNQIGTVPQADRFAKSSYKQILMVLVLLLVLVAGLIALITSVKV
jgi:hypothetical protein